ncbi:MAG: response regulator [Ahniella sp.]|nr:response regulator [Ahniella sp.]
MNRSILLVEDDLITREVLSTQLRALGWEPVVAANLGDASRCLAGPDRFLAALIDLELPDGSGLDLPARHAAQIGHMVASSAEWTPRKRDQALRAGFSATMAKPCSREDLEQALGRPEQQPNQDPDEPGLDSAAPIFDDVAAERALGNTAAVEALRALLVDELPVYRDRLRMHLAEADQVALSALLHRLLSAAGFTGAAALHEAVLAVQAQASPSRVGRVLTEIDRCLLTLPRARTRSR